MANKRNPKTKYPDFWGMARSYLYDYLNRLRGVSPNTIDAYRCALESYLCYLSACGIGADKVGFNHFERSHIKGWMVWMKEEKAYSSHTITLRLSAVKSFLKYCRHEDISLGGLYEEAKEIRPPKSVKRPIEYFENDELASILDAYDGTTQKSRRNRMILICLYETAARVSELCDICLCDVSLAKPATIMLHGKGSKVRSVPISDKTKEHLKVYLDEFHPGKLRRDGKRPLFFSIHKGIPTPLSTDSVSLILKNAADMARENCPGIPEKIHCHLMRKTKAMDLYQSGMALPLVMKFLGHENISTTSSYYAFATQEMMENAIRQASSNEMLEQNCDYLTDERIKALYSLR
ncbi:MAG: site-specific integrase [Eggerthellaceae bacterium]|nr:site-specific integrase [Eggerthellaceae bacterium]